MRPIPCALFVLFALAIVSCAAPPVDLPAAAGPSQGEAPTSAGVKAIDPRRAAPPPGAAEPTRTRTIRVPDTERESEAPSGPAAPSPHDCPPQFSGTCYPVWFGTNRKPLVAGDPSQGFSAAFDDRLYFGKRVVRIPSSHRPGELGSPLWRRLLTGVDDRITVDPATELTAEAFAREVRRFLGGLDESERNVLVYIHGFNTSFDAATLRAAQLGFDLRVPGITALYSWPSRGSVGGYLTDLSSIEASEDLLAEFLVTMTRLADPGKVHIVAHSMGNRGLLRALHRATTQAALQRGMRFGRIFLAAPDVDEKLFRQLASVYPRISERTTLYVADRDRAFEALAWITDGARVGAAPPVVLLPGIDTVRVRGAGLLQLGHSYVSQQVDVLRDIAAQLYWHEPPERRRMRNGWPVPDELSSAGTSWVIGR
jgi:esterase/lipase superfamily enzyme